MLHQITIHVRASQILACVNKAWAHAVRELRKEFRNSAFSADCLGRETFLTHNMVEQRLERVVRRRVGNLDINDDAWWWYRTQFYLHQAVAKHRMSFQDILFRCYIFSKHNHYDFNIFEDVYRHCTSQSLDEPLNVQLFWESGYVAARDMGCFNLGKSIDEVLQTLICAMEGAAFCPLMCSCAGDPQMQLL